MITEAEIDLAKPRDLKPRELADALLSIFDADTPERALECAVLQLMLAAELRMKAVPRTVARVLVKNYDADGNFVDGFYWHVLEKSFEEEVERSRRDGKGAGVLAWQLLTTVDDVPAELMRQYMEFWGDWAGADADEPFELPVDTWNEMIAEIGRAEYAPADATAFVTEFVRRVNKALGMGEPMTRHRCRK